MGEVVFMPVGKDEGPKERLMVSMSRHQMARVKVAAKGLNLTASELCRQAIAFALDHMREASHG